MSSQPTFELEATVRENVGKGASRRLRREQKQLPAIVYGGHEAPLNIMLDHQKMMHALEHEAFYSHILTLNIKGKKQKVILKALQRHHFKKALLHADFQRVSAKDKLHMRIPLHFKNEAEAPGVKAGGLVNHQAIDVEIRCQADQLPEYIEVDLGQLELDHSIHLSQLIVPKGVELLALSHHNDLAVASIHLPRQIQEDEPVVAEEAEADPAAVPSAQKSEAAGPDAKADKAAPAADKKPADKKK